MTSPSRSTNGEQTTHAKFNDTHNTQVTGNFHRQRQTNEDQQRQNNRVTRNGRPKPWATIHTDYRRHRTWNRTRTTDNTQVMEARRPTWARRRNILHAELQELRIRTAMVQVPDPRIQQTTNRPLIKLPVPVIQERQNSDTLQSRNHLQRRRNEDI